MPSRRVVATIVALAVLPVSCGRDDVQSAFCAHAEEVYDSAGSQAERSTNELFLASARRDRTPVLLAPVAGDAPQRNPDHASAAAEVLSVEEELRGHLERFTVIVEERPDCFTFGERADAGRLRRSLDAGA